MNLSLTDRCEVGDCSATPGPLVIWEIMTRANATAMKRRKLEPQDQSRRPFLVPSFGGNFFALQLNRCATWCQAVQSCTLRGDEPVTRLRDAIGRRLRHNSLAELAAQVSIWLPVPATCADMPFSPPRSGEWTANSLASNLGTFEGRRHLISAENCLT